MSIFHKTFVPPVSLKTEKVILFPTDVTFYESDYEAVMESKEMLRIWGQSQWPQDSFSAQENKEDLQFHVKDNEDHTAYGYMIYSPDLNTCYGSLYVNPLTPISENYHLTLDEKQLLNEFDVRLDFWIRENETEIEQHVTKVLSEWFADVWKVEPLFTARTGLQSKLKTYEDQGFKKVLHLISKTSGDLILFRR